MPERNVRVDQQTVFIRKQVPYRKMDGCSIIHLGSRQIYLNETGTQIWELIDGERSVEVIAGEMACSEDENPDAPRNEAVTDFLANLRAKELLLASGNNSSDLVPPAASNGYSSWKQVEPESCQYNPARQTETANSQQGKSTRDRIFQSYWDRKYIEKLHLELTYRCNLCCVHCYNSSHGGASRELTTGQWISVLEQAAELGGYFMVFTGGEPFARKDLLEILLAACRLGYAFRINTNGSMIREHHVPVLESMVPFLQGIDISFYGATAEVHDQVTNRPGSYSKTRAVLDSLFQAKVPVVAKYVTMHMNFDGLRQFEDEMSAAEIPHAVNTGSMIPRTDRNTAPLAQILTDDQYKKLLAARGHPTRGKTSTNCIPGWNRGGITADGFVGPCEWLGDIRLGNVRDTRLREIWYGPGFQALRESMLKAERECLSCDLKNFCCSCPAHAYLETGSLFRCAPVQHHNAKLCSDFFTTQT
jgi:radical SAM protein with 4Fe4S-binding SPASM domain